MSIEDKKQKLNALMTEYSRLKGDASNIARCLSIKNQVATIMFDTSSIVFKYLCKVAKDKSESYPTRYEPDEFVTETFLKYFDEYNCDRNDNFMNYFKYFLKCTVNNMIKREHPEHYPPMPTNIDEEGNEVPIDPPSPNAGPEFFGLMQLFHNISKTSTDSTSENTIDAMQKLFDAEEPISEDEAQIRIQFIEYISKIIPCINQANEHKGKRNVYYRAFATGFYIAASKWSLHSRYDMNENEAFRNMDKEFADWVLTAICRSFMAFETTPCKTYAEIGVTGRDYATGEIETPFKNGVYAVRFKVTESAVSQQRGYFYKDIGILVNEER